MATTESESEQPRNSLIVKLYLPRNSAKRVPSESESQAMDSHAAHKKRKLDSSRNHMYQEECHELKDYHCKSDHVSAVAATRPMREKTEQPLRKNREKTELADSRTGSEESMLTNEGEKCKKEKEKKKKMFEACEFKDYHCKNVASGGVSAVGTNIGTRTKWGKTDQPAKNRETKLADSRTSPRTGSEESVQLKNEGELKNYHCKSDGISAVATARSRTRPMWEKTEQPVRENRETKLVDSRTLSRTGSDESVQLKIDEGEKFKNEKMERYKKMQCWVILKRMMIGRDGWAFKHPLDPVSVDNTVSDDDTALKEKKKKPILGFVDIESKLNNWVYSEPEQFAHDIRNVFSHALLYPPRSEIHRIGRRLSENFELNWKSLKDKWASEDRKLKRSKKI